MASLYCGDECNIEYSMWDGSIRELVMDGELLVDYDDGEYVLKEIGT